MEAHAAAASTIPANVDRNSFLPLHPGAIRYYWQIGRAGQTDSRPTTATEEIEGADFEEKRPRFSRGHSR
jgi:hypothetical protein